MDPYKHPKWKELRNRIYIRDKKRCVRCGDGPRDGKDLHVHHLLYIKDKEPWDVPEYYLVTLCVECHKLEHSIRLTPPSKHY